MPLAINVITKKLPGNVGTCAHVMPTLDLLSSYTTALNVRGPCGSVTTEFTRLLNIAGISPPHDQMT